MRREVLEVLKRAERMRDQLQRVDDALAELDREERLVLEILMEDYDEKIMRICEELEVSPATAYRTIDRVLERIWELFMENRVRIS